MEKYTEANLGVLLADLCRQHKAWTQRTFGPGRKPWNHLVKEAHELAAKPDDIAELANVFLLLIDTLHMAGFKITDLTQAAAEKLAINERRQWGPLDEQGIAQHLPANP